MSRSQVIRARATTRGFDSISLDPSPRLLQLRLDLAAGPGREPDWTELRELVGEVCRAVVDETSSRRRSSRR